MRMFHFIFLYVKILITRNNARCAIVVFCCICSFVVVNELILWKREDGTSECTGCRVFFSFLFHLFVISRGIKYKMKQSKAKRERAKFYHHFDLCAQPLIVPFLQESEWARRKTCFKHLLQSMVWNPFGSIPFEMCIDALLLLLLLLLFLVALWLLFAFSVSLTLILIMWCTNFILVGGFHYPCSSSDSHSIKSRLLNTTTQFSTYINACYCRLLLFFCCCEIELEQKCTLRVNHPLCFHLIRLVLLWNILLFLSFSV